MKRLLHFIERRLHPRYYVAAPVFFDVIDDNALTRIGGPHGAVLADIGRNGFAFLVDRVIYNGFYLLGCLDEDVFKVRLTFSAEIPAILPELTGRIVWIDNVSDSGDRRFKIGVEMNPPLAKNIFGELLKFFVTPKTAGRGEKVESL